MNTYIGRRVSAIRRRRNLDGAFVAAALQLRFTDYRAREAGDVGFTPIQLASLARLFGVDAEEFLSEEQAERPPGKLAS